MKYTRIYIHEYTERIFASNLPYRDRKPKHVSKFSKNTRQWWQAMAPHPISHTCASALPPTSHRDATTPSPCWAPHFIFKERLVYPNPTPSEPRLSPAATMSDDMLSALTTPLQYASILQPATPPQAVAFKSWTISAPICLHRFTLADSRKPDLWTCVCGVTFASASSAVAFLIETDFSFESLFAIWSSSPQRFDFYIYLSKVSWQY